MATIGRTVRIVDVLRFSGTSTGLDVDVLFQGKVSFQDDSAASADTLDFRQSLDQLENN